MPNISDPDLAKYFNRLLWPDVPSTWGPGAPMGLDVAGQPPSVPPGGPAASEIDKAIKAESDKLAGPFKPTTRGIFRFFPSATPSPAAPPSQEVVSGAPPIRVEAPPGGWPSDPAQTQAQLNDLKQSVPDTGTLPPGPAPTPEETDWQKSWNQAFASVKERGQKLDNLITEIENRLKNQENTDAETKEYRDQLTEARRIQMQNVHNALIMSGQPTPPENPDTQKALWNGKNAMGMIGPIVTMLMAIGSVIAGGKGYSSAAVNFANMYNGMVDSWRKRDFENFEKATADFQNHLAKVKAENDAKVQEYTAVLQNIITGVDISDKMHRLKMEEFNRPLELLLMRAKLLQDANQNILTMQQNLLTEGMRMEFMKWNREDRMRDQVMRGYAALALVDQRYETAMKMYLGLEEKEFERLRRVVQSKGGVLNAEGYLEEVSEKGIPRIRWYDKQGNLHWEYGSSIGIRPTAPTSPRTGGSRASSSFPQPSAPGAGTRTAPGPPKEFDAGKAQRGEYKAGDEAVFEGWIIRKTATGWENVRPIGG